MKIIHIIPSLKKGGAERITIDICRELNNRPNIEIMLISLNETNHYKPYLKDLNFLIIPSNVIPSIIGTPFTNLNELHHTIEAFNPDIIHTHLFKAEIISKWFLAPNVTYFSHLHDNMFQFKRFKLKHLCSKKRLTELYERRLMIKKYLQCENYFIAISKHTREYYYSNLPSKLHNKISLLPNAIDFDRFNCKGNDEKNEKKIKIVNVGNFLKKKNISFFIPIAKKLKERGIDFEIILIGDGITRNDISKQIINEGLSNCFNLVGFIDKVEEVLWECDIYVHTATYEPFGLVLLEAMAAKLPTISLNGGGNIDIIEHGVNGFIIENQNAQVFSDTIIKINEDRILKSEIIEKGYETAKSHNIKEYTDNLINLYTKHTNY